MRRSTLRRREQSLEIRKREGAGDFCLFVLRCTRQEFEASAAPRKLPIKATAREEVQDEGKGKGKERNTWEDGEEEEKGKWKKTRGKLKIVRSKESVKDSPSYSFKIEILERRI